MERRMDTQQTSVAVVYGITEAVKLFQALDNDGITAQLETMGSGGVRYKIVACCYPQTLSLVCSVIDIQADIEY